MPFPWYQPDVPKEFSSAGSKAVAMYRDELGQRAALLRRLGFSRQEVVMRLRGNLTWDFELNKRSVLLDQIDGIVEEVFLKRSYGGGGPPSLEG